jgi:hypothetical protein
MLAAWAGLVTVAPGLARELDYNDKRRVAEMFFWNADLAQSHLALVKQARSANDRALFCKELSEANHYIVQMQTIASRVSRDWYATDQWELAVKMNDVAGKYDRAHHGLNGMGNCSK